MTKKKRTAKPKTPAKAAKPVDSMLVPLDSIHPWDKNPRKNAGTVADFVKSIKRFGWVRPIVVNTHPEAKGEIIVGHTARLAALKMKLKKVPVRFVSMDPKEAHAAALADNRLGEQSLWDYDMLGTLTNELTEELFSFAGFHADDFQRLAEGEAGDFLNETVRGEVPEPAVPATETSEYTMIFNLTMAQIRKAKEVLKSIGGDKSNAFMVLVDRYGEEKQE